MSLSLTRSRFFAPLCSLTGAGLLAAAWPVGERITTPGLSNALFLLWVLVLFPLMLAASHPRFSGKTRLRLWLVLCLFALSIISRGRGANAIYTVQAIGMLGLALLATGLWHWPRLLTRITHARTRLARYRLPAKYFTFLAFCAMLTTTLTLSWLCFEFLPAIMDSNAQYVHARFMADGHWFGPQNPLRHFFPVWMVVPVGKFFAQYQPLHIMLLAAGHLIHAPWLINPLSASVTLLATYAIARRVFSPHIARLSVFLMLTSQYILFLSTEYMNHATALMFCTLFMLCYIHASDASLAKNTRRAACLGFATGLCLGAVFLIRPFSAIGMGLPFVAHGLLILCKSPRTYGPAFALATLGAALCIAFQFWYNDASAGNIFMFPSSYYHHRKLSSAIGFGGQTPFSFANTLIKAQNEWWMMNRYLFEWPVPCLLLLALYAARPLKNIYARLMLVSILTHTALNMVNQFYSNLFGPRYLYETASVLIILSAAGLARLPVLLSALPRNLTRPQRASFTYALCAFLFLISLTERLPRNIAYYANHYIDNNPGLYHAMRAQAQTPALIFMGRAMLGKNEGYKTTRNYRSMSFTYPPSPTDDIIFAQDLGDIKNRELIDSFPNRHNYIETNGILSPAPLIQKVTPPQPAKTP